MYLSSFATNVLTIFGTYALIFCLFSSDTLQMLMLGCPSISDIRFYGCCHSCYISNETNSPDLSFKKRNSASRYNEENCLSIPSY